MLKYRPMTPDDLVEVRQLHDNFYGEFEFPRFRQMMCGFVIEDEKGILMAGGVEAVGEALLVTNKDRSRIKIGKGLVLAQSISTYICQQFGIKDMYAFVNNSEYAKHLIRHGFEDCDRALKLRIPDGEEKESGS